MSDKPKYIFGRLASGYDAGSVVIHHTPAKARHAAVRKKQAKAMSKAKVKKPLTLGDKLRAEAAAITKRQASWYK